MDDRIDRRRFMTAGIAGTTAAIVGTSIASRSTPAVAAAGTLLAADEFDGPAGSAPNSAVWRYDLGAGGWGNGELQTYTDSRRNAALDGAGNLVITARREADGSFTSARLKTEGTSTA